MLKKLLSQSSYWVINKELVKHLGFEPTLLLTHLIECADMLGQPFYQQRQRIMNSLEWTEYQYKKSVKILKDKNLISAELKGMPPMNYWTINENEIYSLFGSNAPDKWVNITHPNKRENHPTKTRNKKTRNNNTSLGEIGTGENPDGSPTRQPIHPKEQEGIDGGYEKLLSLFPKEKTRDEMDAIVIWGKLPQSEKQNVIRHASVYVKNTDKKYIKQIGKYLQSELWKNMKPKMNKEEKLFQKGLTLYKPQETDISIFSELT